MSYQYGPPGGAPPSYSPLPEYQQPPAGQYPPQGHSPIPQFAPPAPAPYPTHSQHPPQGHSPIPQDRAYGAPPPNQHPPQGYPQQGYPSSPSAYGQYQGYPPQDYTQQGYPPQGYPQQQPFSQGYPPQHQSYGAPPPAGYPPPQPPQPQHFGAQAQGSYYGGPPTIPTAPTPGYGPELYSMPSDELQKASKTLYEAMHRLGTDEAALIRVLAHFPATSINALKNVYKQTYRLSLEDHIYKETSGYFRLALISILRGPLQQDVYLANKALKGVGTNEHLLNDVLLSRSNADLIAIKQAYHRTYGQSLESDVSGDLSGKTDRLFSMILSATRQEDSAPAIPEVDVTEIHRATEAKLGTEQLTVCSIISSRSDGQIRAIANTYDHRYRTSLEKVVSKEFSGHMKQALVLMVRAGTDRAMRDAMLLEETMAGIGTKDELLVFRVVGLHWNKEHMGQVKGAYRSKYKKELATRIRGEVKGDYQRILLAMIE